MGNRLFYHFWSIENSTLPFDLNQDYCCLTEANDKKFIEDYKYIQKNIDKSTYTYKLLKFYLDVLYDEEHPDDIIDLAIDWIAHTSKILLKCGITYGLINFK